MHRILKIEPPAGLTVSILFMVFALLALPGRLTAQSERITTLRITSDTLKIDTLSLVPGSWKLSAPDGNLISDSLYSIDWVRSLLIRRSGFPVSTDSMRLTYHVYPVNLNRTYRHKEPDFNRISPPTYRLPGGAASRDEAQRLSEGMLQSSGSLSRGVALGNTRDASLTSNLNLQLEGRLNKDYRIEATLTDSNIPVQPEGNTQQIQEFDKIFMRIYSSRNEILAGDFDLRASEGYFLQMNKRVQGARFTTQRETLDRKPGYRTSTGAAVVKGKYARNQLAGSEGNQGPYLLTGANGENYIQIIAGSEKVFIDGQPLIRGEDADYTIDYNTAEVRFTPKNLITRDKRILVEFEYTERSYSRFLVFSENRWSTRSGTWYFNVFSENDAKNQPLLQDLSDANKALLSAIGDDSGLARVSAIRESPFRSDRVFYKQADTLVNGELYTDILIQSYHPDSAKYEAGFSFVGAGNGNYVPVQSAANGRVFKWVAPVNGVPAGGYEPVTRLVMPQSKQIFSAGTRQSIGSRMRVEMEGAITRNDRNTFSSIDDSDNTGIGLKTKIERKDYLRRDSSLMLGSYLNYRFTGSRFDPLERYREVEFERDWNLTTGGPVQQENFLESGVTLSGRDSLRAAYRVEYLSLKSDYSGLRQFTSGNLTGKQWSATWSGSYLLSADAYRNTAFLRHTAQVNRRLGHITIGLSENSENNQWTTPDSDTLLTNSQAFQEFRLEASEKRGDRQPWMVRLSNRADRLPLDGRLVTSSRAWDAESWLDLSKNPALPFRAGFHFRTLDAGSEALLSGESGQTLTGRIENRWQAWKGRVRSQTFFEIGSGFDRKPEYSYLEVAAGQGYYTWNDYNGNNIKELNEFETAFFRDQATFIRVFRLGTGFTPTLVNRFNQVFTIQPKKGLASRFASQLAYRIDKKTGREDYLFLLNPFTTDPSDPRLINLNSQLRHSLSFNKTGQKFNADLVTQKQSARSTLINGADGRVNWSNSLLLRYRFHPAWQLNATTDWSRKESVSEFFDTRNYVLVSQSQVVRLECQAGTAIRIGIDWELRSEKNKTDEQDLLSNRIESSFIAQIPEKGQVTLSLRHVYIRFDGQAGSPAGYAMLRGFTNGHNGVAELSARYKLGKNLVLEALYEGRIVRGGKTVHNAQLQVRAVF